MAVTTAGKVKWEAIIVCFDFFIGKPVTLCDLTTASLGFFLSPVQQK